MKWREVMIYRSPLEINCYGGKVKGQPEFTLLAETIDKFYMSSVDVEFTFIREKGTNLVKEIVMRQNRREYRGRKWAIVLLMWCLMNKDFFFNL